MNTDVVDPTPAADPGPPTETGRLTPPEATGPTPPGDAWGDHATPAPGSDNPSNGRNRILAGVGAVAIAGAAIFGVSTLGHSSSATATANGPGGFGGGAGAAGFQGGPGGGTRGTITAIDGSTFTIKTATGTAKVSTSASTTVSASSTGSLSSIGVGDHLLVVGATSGSTVTPTAIIDRGAAATALPTGGAGTAPSGASSPSASSRTPTGAPSGGPGGGGFPGGGPPISGTVTQVSGDHITVSGTDGTTYTVAATSTTPVTVERSATISSLATGETVSVRGQTSGTTIAADRITEGTTTGP